MEREELMGKTEAILFAGGEPVALERIAQVLGVRTYAIEEIIDALRGKVQYAPQRGPSSAAGKHRAVLYESCLYPAGAGRLGSEAEHAAVSGRHGGVGCGGL